MIIKAVILVCYGFGALLSLVTLGIAVILMSSGKNRLIWFGFSLGGLFLLIHTIGSLLTPHELNEMTTFDTYFYLISPALILSVLLMVRKQVESLEDRNRQLSQIAKYDCLTGALSRYEIERRTVYELERADRNQHPLAFLEVDVDHFKKINDTYGHDVGDEVLRSLVHCLRNELRAFDLVGRLGGEEFLVLLPEADADDARIVAERLCHTVSHHEHHTCAAAPLYITISIGVMVYTPNGSTTMDHPSLLKELLVLVDQAMYRAKKNGRNRVHCHNCSE